MFASRYNLCSIMWKFKVVSWNSVFISSLPHILTNFYKKRSLVFKSNRSSNKVNLWLFLLVILFKIWNFGKFWFRMSLTKGRTLGTLMLLQIFLTEGSSWCIINHSSFQVDSLSIAKVINWTAIAEYAKCKGCLLVKQMQPNCHFNSSSCNRV